ncbi:MAG: rRNA (guanosine2251-2-O)-methyltransferase [Thermoleophilaceae bacterium]|nr:rRNA (guanosine2251-2-O)-methyltransferase [Thermoleophilaceae bacterium]
MIVYGRNAVREALRGRRAVSTVWAGGGAAREPWLRELALRSADDAELEALCGSPDHQGVCAEVAEFEYADAAGLLRGENALVVCLDQVQDPRNLGAVCRVAECAGAAGVVIGERRAAQVTPVVCRASAGAVEHLPVARVRNVADYLAEAKQEDAWVYGASLAPGAVPYDQPDYRGRVVLVLGSEGSGLRPRVAAACDGLVELPLHGRIESLNVSAAAAALLYGILHLRAKALDKVP